MTRPLSDIEADEALLRAAVREAGALALDHFERGVESWEKRPGDPVSDADIAVDRLLCERLTGARPDYGWLSEESVDDGSRLGRRRVWIVDPIDGTRAFLKGLPEFAVAVGLVEDGEPVLGSVFNPATGEFFEARRGTGARLNGRPIETSNAEDPASAHYLASRNALKRQDWIGDVCSIRRTWMNSIAYRLALIAAGRYDAVISPSGKADWDICAADLIVREAGGRCTTFAGAAFSYNRPRTRHPDVVAAGPALHAKLTDLLK